MDLSCFAFNEWTITWYDIKCPKSIIIPNEINWEKVIAIWDNAFNSKSLTSIKLPDSLIVIWKNSFAWNELTKINIPNSVTSIWHNAFIQKVRLNNINIPMGIELHENSFWDIIYIKSKITLDDKAACEELWWKYFLINNICMFSDENIKQKDEESTKTRENNNFPEYSKNSIQELSNKIKQNILKYDSDATFENWIVNMKEDWFISSDKDIFLKNVENVLWINLENEKLMDHIFETKWPVSQLINVWELMFVEVWYGWMRSSSKFIIDKNWNYKVFKNYFKLKDCVLFHWEENRYIYNNKSTDVDDYKKTELKNIFTDFDYWWFLSYKAPFDWYLFTNSFDLLNIETLEIKKIKHFPDMQNFEYNISWNEISVFSECKSINYYLSWWNIVWSCYIYEYELEKNNNDFELLLNNKWYWLVFYDEYAGGYEKYQIWYADYLDKIVSLYYSLLLEQELEKAYEISTKSVDFQTFKLWYSWIEEIVIDPSENYIPHKLNMDNWYYNFTVSIKYKDNDEVENYEVKMKVWVDEDWKPKIFDSKSVRK